MNDRAGEKGEPGPRGPQRRGPAPWYLAGLVLLGACGSAGRVAAPTTDVTATVPVTVTVPVTAVLATTTTIYRASAPLPSPDLAGSHLTGAWRTGDRAGALTGATASAVEAVFGQPYPAAGVQARGCSQAVAGPSSCDYRVNSGLLKLNAVAVSGGWIIDAATFER